MIWIKTAVHKYIVPGMPRSRPRALPDRAIGEPCSSGGLATGFGFASRLSFAGDDAVAALVATLLGDERQTELLSHHAGQEATDRMWLPSRRLRDRHEGHECSSACVLILAAGVDRNPWGRIGIHRPHFDEKFFAQLTQAEARKKYDQMADTVRRYLAKMGLSENLYTAMLHVPSDDVVYLTVSQLNAYGLHGQDAGWSEWRRAKLIQQWGRDEYDTNKSLISVLQACTDKTGDGEACYRQVKPEFERQLDICQRTQANNSTACAGQVAQRMILRYQ